MRRVIPGFIPIIVVLCALGACSGPMPASGPYAGLSGSYEPGLPSFDAQIQPGVSGSSRGLQIDVSVSEFSLVFRSVEDQLGARIEWLIRLLSSDGRQVLEEQTRRQDLSRSAGTNPSLFRHLSFSSFMEAAPGRYRVHIQLEDLNSQKLESKELLYDLPSRNQPLIATELLLENADERPLISLAFPDTVRPGKAVFHLTGNVSRAARINFNVLSLDIDSSAARTPYWQGPGSGFSGISPAEYPVTDTLFFEQRSVRRGALRRVAFDLPLSPIGAYRVDAAIDDLQTEGERPTLQRSRYYIVRRASFPRLETYMDLIPPLVYLADASEWEVLREAMYSDGARNEFDSFWGRRISDRRIASNTVRGYYSRVEEANLRYADFREGWRTDRGMVYIILGEPLFVERSLEAEIWYYSYSGERGERSFVFHRVYRSNTPQIVEEYKLDRSFEYERFWRGEIDRWRRGEN